MSRVSRAITWPSVLAVTALVSASVFGSALPANAQTTPGTAELTSGSLRVTVSTKFPQIVSYDRTGSATGHMDGNATPLKQVRINDVPHDVTVSASSAGGTEEDYRMTVADLGVTIDAAITVADANTVTFAVTAIEDPNNEVESLEIPGQDFVSVSSSDPHAQLATTNTGGGDTFTPIQADTAPDAKPVYSSYAIVTNSTMSASVVSNSTQNEPMDYQASNNCGQGLNTNPQADNQRLQHQIVDDGHGGRSVGVSSGPWLYRVKDPQTNKTVATNELPWTKISLQGDANADGTVNWQDGAIGLRQIDYTPYGAASVPDTVVYRIPFNVASEATNPFLKTLDNTKLVNQATDGLGQLALLKGYQGEGQDTSHPDYGDDFNTRAGGLTDFNTMLDEGQKLNATFGVHINESEAYPEAKDFSPDMLATPDGKICQRYSWLDSGYYIDQFKDISSGDFAARVKQLADATDDNLSMVYVDTYFSQGWLADSVVKTLNDNGFSVATEDSSNLDRGAILGHGAIQDGSGNSSQILRFVHNSDMDKWAPDPLLGRTDLEDFEGWHGGSDWNASKTKIWTDNLPTKYLQHFQILSEQPGKDTFTGNVVATGPVGATTTDQRVVTQDGATVIDGTSYLIPWTDSVGDTTAPRLYHYNADGGQTTWTLTDAFKNTSTFELYKLTDAGKVDLGPISAQGGTVTLNADPGTAYVLYPTSTKPVTNNVQYGDGGPVADPGFNAGNLDVWHPSGDATASTYLSGQPVASFGPGASSISQQLGKLDQGTYSASVELEIKPGYTRPTTLSVSGAGVMPVSNTIDRSTAPNTLNSDTKHGTYAQRMSVTFQVAADGARPTLSISAPAAADAAATVMLDDVRVVSTQVSSLPAPAKGVAIVSEDFEHTPAGWGPFVKDGSTPDPHIHIARKNGIYTQVNEPGSLAGNYDKTIDDVVDGNWSLRSHDDSGQIYRTWDGTANLIPGHHYQVSLKYEAAAPAKVNIGHDSESATPTETIDQQFPLPATSVPTEFSQSFTVTQPHSFIGIQAGGKDISVDDVQIVDLSATPLSVSATLAPPTPNGNNGWYHTHPSLKLTTTGGVSASSAAPTVQYSLDNGKTWTTYSAPVSLPDGSGTVAYRAYQGSQHASGSIAVKRDACAPSIQASISQPDPSAAAAVTISATDPTSGIQTMKYRVDGGAWSQAQPAGHEATASLELAKPGKHTVEVSATDVAGNQSTKHTTVTVAASSGGSSSGGSGSSGSTTGGSTSSGSNTGAGTNATGAQLGQTGANLWPAIAAALAVIAVGVGALILRRRVRR